jgi:hypothetical protein
VIPRPGRIGEFSWLGRIKDIFPHQGSTVCVIELLDRGMITRNRFDIVRAEMTEQETVEWMLRDLSR